MKRLVFTWIALMIVIVGFPQPDSNPLPVKLEGYLETYFLFDFTKPSDNTLPQFIYSYNRHNEVNVNLAFLKGSYETEKVRANLGLMTGTYANANLAAEPGVLKNIYEANAGIKISSDKTVWIDAGIFASHIGFESAHAPDCWTLTRSMLADNSPYYEAGVKVSYTTDSERWFLSALLLNGWQRIQRVDGNSLPSFGTQVTFTPNKSVTLNHSTFIGTDKPDSARQMRYFQNLYGIFHINEKAGIIVGFDYGLEEKSPETRSTYAWFSPVVIARYSINDKISLAVRGEYYHDKNGVIIAIEPGTQTSNGFRTTGFSINMDFQITPKVLWRTEVKNLNSKEKIFSRGTSLCNTNTFAGTSLAVNL